MVDYAREHLRRQLIGINKDPPEGVSVGLHEDNLFKWEVVMTGPVDSPFEGGLFSALLEFPPDFPNNPPVMRFTSELWHPNVGSTVYPDGTVCISILHPPGEDQFNEMESAEERWRPILGVDAILKSVQLLLAHPNIDSPANIDAGVQYREDRKDYNKRARRCASKTLGE